MPGAGELLTLFVWFAAVAVAGVCGFYLALRVRKWTQREERVGSFTLQDLRDLRARGQITEWEFVAMRAALLSELRVAPDTAHPPPDDGTPPPGRDVPPPDGTPSPP